MALKHRHAWLKSRKGILLTLFTIVLFILMLSELLTYVVLNINYNNLETEIGRASGEGAMVQNINSSLSTFLYSSLSGALSGLTYYESTPSIRKDSFINNTGTALAAIMETGAYKGYSLSGYEGATLGQYIAALVKQAGAQGASISITNGTLSVVQSGAFTIMASYTAMLTVNQSGTTSDYPIDAVANVSTGSRPYLLGAEQGIYETLVPGTASPNATLVGNMYAKAGSTSPYMFAYGTVVYYPGEPNCGTVASGYKSSSYILATPNAADIGQSVCGMAGLVTNITNSSTPIVPYLLYKNASIMSYLQNSQSLLLDGQGLALLNTTPLQQAVQYGYAYASPYMPTYLQRAQSSLFSSSPSGFYTFSPLNVKVAQFNGAGYITTGGTNLPISNSAKSVFAWVNIPLAPSTFEIIYSYGTTTSNNWSSLHLGAGGVVCFSNYGPNYCTTLEVAPNRWYLVGYTYSAGIVTAYIDGVPQTVATGLSLSTTLPTSDPSDIGKCSDSSCGGAPYYFDGNIADVQIYNTSLTPAQVSQIYQEGINGGPISNAGLVGWWPLNGNATDMSGQGNSGTASSVVYAAPEGYTFDPLSSEVPGAPSGMVGKFVPDQNISIQTAAPLLSGSNVTMAVWIDWNGGSPGGRQEVLGADSAPGYEINPIIAVNDSGTQEAETWVCVSTCWPEAKSGPDTIVPHRWYFLTSRYNGTDVSLWIDGRQVASTPATGNLVPQGSGLYAYIGSRSNTGNYFNGLIAGAQMYGSSLTAAEIQQLYSEGIDGGPVASADVVGWWPLSNSANDYSGNGNNGVLHGATYTPFENSPTANLVEGVLNCANLDQCSNSTLQHLYLDPLPLEHAGMGFMNETTSFNMMGAALPDAMSLNGVNNYAAAEVGTWLGTNHNFTISAWYYSPSGGGSIVNICTSPTCGGWSTPFLGYNTNGSTYAWINGPAVLWSSTPFGKWYFAEIAYSASTSSETLYINGQAVASASGAYSPSSAIDYATIGADPTGQHYGNVYFNGKITDVQVYNRTLTAPQSLQLYLNNSVNGIAPLDYWPLGTGMNGLLNETPDIVSGNTGYLYGSSGLCTNSQVVNGQCGPSYTPP